MIDVAYYVFHSPDLKAEEDRREIEERGFSAVRVILTPYQQDRAGAYMHKYGPGMRYLFILFINQGGTVKNMRIRLTRWEPKENRSIPKGAGDIPSLGALPSGQAYALLVDAAQGIDALKPLRASHAEEVCVEYTYTDFADEMYRPQIRCLTDKAPFDADGVIMGIWTFMHGEEQDLEGGWEWK